MNQALFVTYFDILRYCDRTKTACEEYDEIKSYFNFKEQKNYDSS